MKIGSCCLCAFGVSVLAAIFGGEQTRYPPIGFYEGRSGTLSASGLAAFRSVNYIVVRDAHGTMHGFYLSGHGDDLPMSFSAGGRWLAVGGDFGVGLINCLNWKTFGLPDEVPRGDGEGPVHYGFTGHVAVDGNGTRVLSARWEDIGDSRRAVVRLWNVRTRTFTRLTRNYVFDVGFVGDGHKTYVVSLDDKNRGPFVEIFDSQLRKLGNRFIVNGLKVTFSPKGAMFAVWTRGSVALYLARNGRPLGSVQGANIYYRWTKSGALVSWEGGQRDFRFSSGWRRSTGPVELRGTHGRIGKMGAWHLHEVRTGEPMGMHLNNVWPFMKTHYEKFAEIR